MMKCKIEPTFSKSHLIPFVCVSVLMLFTACSEADLSDEAFTMGADVVESHTQLGFIDTLSVKLSTVILDSVPTSGTGRVLVGQHTDDEFGTIHSTSYFQLNATSTSIGEEAIFDSLVLVLGYDGYYYGDTLKEQTVQVYPLSEVIEENSDGFLYSTSNIPTKNEPIGSKTFKPIISKKTLEIRLSDELGKDFFAKIINEDFSSSDDFLEEFPGVALKILRDDGAIMGYSIDDTSTYMIMYYHQDGQVKSELTATFIPLNTDLQFNKIETDRTGTVLESWTEQRYAIPANKTNNQVFIQGATGVLTRIEFPSLNYFVELGEQGSLLKAVLTFVPIKGTYDEMEIPNNTVLYQTDKRSGVYTEIYDSDGESIQYGTTNTDHQYHENTYISFDLSAYFKYDFLDNYYDEERGFLLGLSDPEFCSSFDRVILGGLNNPNYTPQLMVYYILYQIP